MSVTTMIYFHYGKYIHYPLSHIDTHFYALSLKNTKLYFINRTMYATVIISELGIESSALGSIKLNFRATHPPEVTPDRTGRRSSSRPHIDIFYGIPERLQYPICPTCHPESNRLFWNLCEV